MMETAGVVVRKTAAKQLAREITVRKLNVATDRACLVDAYAWEMFAPCWFKDADVVFGPPTLADFIVGSQQADRATFGIFDGELAGLVILTLRNGSLEADLMARPHISREIIACGAATIRDTAFTDLPVTSIYCWLPKLNRPTRRLCAIIGFRDSGVRMLKGTYHNRLIEWQQLIITRESWEARQLAVAA